MKLKDDPSGHEEVSDYRALPVLESDMTQSSLLDSQLDGAENAQVEAGEAAQALPTPGPNSQSHAAPANFQESPLSNMGAPQEINVSDSALLPPGLAQEFLDENVQDLNILWGSMDANFPLEGLGFGLPNEIISLPGFDISETTPPGLSGPPTNETHHETVPESPPSDDDASLSNFQLPSLQRNGEANSHDIDNIPQGQVSNQDFLRGHEPSSPWRIGKED